MKIHKIGHCCLAIEDKDVRLLTDPGIFSTGQNEWKGVDALLVTHEHADHMHLDSVKAILDNNPTVRIITNSAVAKILDEAGVPCELLADGATTMVGGLSVNAIEGPHAFMHKSIPQVLNTGFVIGDRFFYPGDAFLNPFWPTEILALPISGPWLSVSDCIDYVLKLKPKTCIPVHDALLKSPTMFHGMFKRILEAEGIAFVPLDAGEHADF